MGERPGIAHGDGRLHGLGSRWGGRGHFRVQTAAWKMVERMVLSVVALNRRVPVTDETPRRWRGSGAGEGPNADPSPGSFPPRFNSTPKDPRLYPGPSPPPGYIPLGFKPRDPSLPPPGIQSPQVQTPGSEPPPPPGIHSPGGSKPRDRAFPGIHSPGVQTPGSEPSPWDTFPWSPNPGIRAFPPGYIPLGVQPLDPSLTISQKNTSSPGIQAFPQDTFSSGSVPRPHPGIVALPA
ncbi:uncharacterized protein [Narcine bancroftii]|uniref:uncharacterized protein n=1 Tax=Narcine bancroftii TaxID=1343680 RepID=UPI0038318C1B